MGIFDYIEKLFEQTENLNDRISKVEIELKKLKNDVSLGNSETKLKTTEKEVYNNE